MDAGKCNRIEREFSKKLERYNDDLEGLIDGANLSDPMSTKKICKLDTTATNDIKEIESYKKGVNKNSNFYVIFDSLSQDFKHFQNRLYTNYKSTLEKSKNMKNKEFYVQ
jgi:hypothetical protein